MTTYYAIVRTGAHHTRWKAGFVTGVSADGIVLIDDCSAPFNGQSFRTRRDAVMFAQQHHLCEICTKGDGKVGKGQWALLEEKP